MDDRTATQEQHCHSEGNQEGGMRWICLMSKQFLNHISRLTKRMHLSPGWLWLTLSSISILNAIINNGYLRRQKRRKMLEILFLQDAAEIFVHFCKHVKMLTRRHGQWLIICMCKFKCSNRIWINNYSYNYKLYFSVSK